MITYNDQLDLFKLISKTLTKDISCFAFGGTAMLFYGYKDSTKDIDLLFEEEEDRNGFLKAIQFLGFSEFSPANISISEKLEETNRPLMYKKGEIRFDIFLKNVFRTQISPQMKEDLFAVHEFKGKHNFQIKVVGKEHIVFLKGITERQIDFDDIRTIIEKEKNFDWQYLIDETIWQHKHGDSWVIIDIEKMLQDLKEYVFIEEKYFKQLYEAQEEK